MNVRYALRHPITAWRHRGYVGSFTGNEFRIPFKTSVMPPSRVPRRYWDAPLTTGSRELSAFSNILKQEFLGPIRAMMRGDSLAFGSWADKVDPWEDAVRWLEAREAARVEWPWPTYHETEEL